MATPPRRLTWEDTGQHRATDEGTVPTGFDACRSQLCDCLGKLVNLRVKAAFHVIARQVHCRSGVQTTRNALTNAIKVTHRRRCVLPNDREIAIPQYDWAVPASLILDGSITLVGCPGVTFFVDANCASRQWRLGHTHLDTSHQHNFALRPTPPEVDYDPFGHGGGLV